MTTSKRTIKSVDTVAARSTRSNARRNNRRFGVRSGRERRLMTVVALLSVALIGSIGIAIAAFSTNLQISGDATVNATVWDIHFADLQPVATTGQSAKELTAPTIQNSAEGKALAAIKGYSVQLKNPGDAIEYTFNVVNAGDVDAELQSIAIKTASDLTCASSAGTDVADKVCAKMNYTITHADGTTLAVGEALAKGSSRSLKLKLEFDPSATEEDLPSKDVSVSGLDVVLTYGQKN